MHDRHRVPMAALLIFSQLLSWLTLLPRAPARKALRAVLGKVKTWCRRMDTNQPLEVLLLRLNQMLRGWCANGCCSTRRSCPPPRYRYRGAVIPAAWPVTG
jgi:hypothetical protein